MPCYRPTYLINLHAIHIKGCNIQFDLIFAFICMPCHAMPETAIFPAKGFSSVCFLSRLGAGWKYISGLHRTSNWLFIHNWKSWLCIATSRSSVLLSPEWRYRDLHLKEIVFCFGSYCFKGWRIPVFLKRILFVIYNSSTNMLCNLFCSPTHLYFKRSTNFYLYQEVNKS